MLVVVVGATIGLGSPLIAPMSTCTPALEPLGAGPDSVRCHCVAACVAPASASRFGNRDLGQTGWAYLPAGQDGMRAYVEDSKRLAADEFSRAGRPAFLLVAYDPA
jgi:hypothetical protein